MGHEGKILVRREDKRAAACNLFGGETVITTGNKGTDQNTHSVELAITPSYFVQRSIVEKILKRLQNDNIHSIGIVGMAGSGKTTVAKEVCKKAKELNLFNLVVFITVPYRDDGKKIQSQMADILGLRLVTEDFSARATQIFERLQSEERILIILDDIWVRLDDLQQIGIPSSENPKGCKLMLTTRYMHILGQMGCQFEFRQHLLTDEGVWSLFCKWAGIENVSLDPNILDLSKKLVQKCGGSPLAASLAGGCLRGKTVDEWVVAINIILQDSTRMEDYNYNPFFLLVKWICHVGLLSGKVAKSLLLISALFPRVAFLIEHLSHYAITLGLCGKNEVTAALNSLIYCGVLMHYDETNDYVAMHDFVRDGALRILQEENPAYNDRIREYLSKFYYEGFGWKEELDELVHQIFHVRDDSSSSSIVPFSHHVYTHSEPSGKLVDFNGMCHVDASYLPFLKEVCKRYPQLIECQAKHSKTLKQTAFNNLGQLLFMLNNAAVSDWVYLKDELRMYWDQALAMQFDLEWLKPHVDTMLSSTEIHRIEAHRKELEKRNEEAAKLRQQLIDIEAIAEKVRQRLNHVEAEATHYKNEIDQLESKFKFNGYTITDVSKSPYVVFKVNPWQKIFRKRK